MQRRISFSALIIVCCLLVGGLFASGGRVQAQMPGTGVGANVAGAQGPASTPEESYTRKLPPPAGSAQPGPSEPGVRPMACANTVVNASQRSGNEDESFVVVNPTNPNNIVAFSNLAVENSIFRAYTMNGGTSWTRGTIATNAGCCDAQAAFDSFGNLFMVYINGAVNQINVVLSTDGGATFSTPVTVGVGSVDQPSIAVGNGSVWVDWNQSGSMQARGAPVTGLGAWGPFGAAQSIPSGTGSFGGIAVGPGPNGGKVMVTYMNPTGGQGPATIYVNVDADGLGAGGFGPRITATSTNVGGFDFIPAQAGRSVDTEAGLVWDGTGGAFNNRAYLVYTEEPVNENNDTEIFLRTSTDDGATWSAPVRVNDDPPGPIRSQFLPYIALDRSSGTVAIGWHDARNDNGVPGVGGTNTIANDDAEYYASYSTNGGVSWAVNQRLSGGFSNAAAADAPVDYGDYEGQSAENGKFVALWADNSNCDGTNPNGTLHAFDLYMATMDIPGGATPTATATGFTTTPTRTGTPSNTATASSTPTWTNTPTVVCTPGGPYVYTTTTGTPYVVGSTDTGNHCDNCTTTISLPFPVRFFQFQSFTSAIVGSNGILAFTANGNSPTNSCLPDVTSNNAIFALWDDLRTDGAGGAAGIYTLLSGSAPTRSFVIEWRACLNTGAPCSAVDTSFEIVFHELSDTFEIQYGNMANNGATATIGTQRSTSGSITTFSCNVASLQPGLVTIWRPLGCGEPFPTFTPTFTNTPTALTNTPTRTSTLTPTSTPDTCSIDFTDVSTADYFYTAVQYLYCHGAISGYSDGTFRPYNSTTRGQLSKIVVLAVGLPIDTTGGPHFTDVPSSNPFYAFIETAYNRGLISGYADGTFRWGNNVTRAQLSKIIVIAEGWPINTTGGPHFTDVPTTNGFYSFVETAYNHGIIGGYADGTFRPNNDATRGQISVIVYRALTAP